MKKFLMFLCVMFVCATYADTETINWYVGGSVYNTTTCQSGGDVNLPTQPTKRGHTFAGWMVALYDFSTLDYTINGTGASKNTSARTWTVMFDYGLVSGISLCSVTSGFYVVRGNPDTSDGQYCWCKATGYIPSGSNIAYENVSSSPWIFYTGFSSAASCASGCPDYCGFYGQRESAFRRAMFGIQ